MEKERGEFVSSLLASHTLPITKTLETMNHIGLETKLVCFALGMATAGGILGFITRCQTDVCLLDPNTTVHAIGRGAAAGVGAAIGTSLPALFSKAPEVKRKNNNLK